MKEHVRAMMKDMERRRLDGEFSENIGRLSKGI